MHLWVSYSEERSGGEKSEPGQWSSRAPTYITVTVEGLFLEEPDSLYRESVEVMGELTWAHAGEQAYLLVVRHSDGDTYGSSYGHAHFEGVYETLKEAEAVAQTINDGSYSNKRYKPWDGFFTKLEGIEIHSMTINKSSSSAKYKMVKHY